MTVLSTGVFSISPVTNYDEFVPFIIYGEILPNPGYGNRWEMIREYERIANLIEMSLNDLVDNGIYASTGDNYEFEIAGPVHFTPAFGQYYPRITIVGHVRKTRNDPPPKKVADDVIQLNANVAVEGQGAFNAANLTPNVWVNDMAKYLRDLFSDESRIPFINKMCIKAVEVLGIRYGDRGRHFSL